MNNKILAAAIVAIMAMVTFIPLASAENNDADVSTSWGGDYTYTLTLNETTNTSAPITFTLGGDLAGRTPVTAGDPGDFAFDSNGYGPFNSFYALFDSTGTELGRLDPSDLSLYMDGTNAPITTNNVMWVIPTVYWSVNGSTLTMSNKPFEGAQAYAHTIDGTIYNNLAIGVYEATSTGTFNSSTSQGAGTLTSCSEKSPRVSATREIMRAEAGGVLEDGGYRMLWNFYQWDLYRFAVMSITGTYYNQNVFGAGVLQGAGLSAGSQTGKLNSSGPYSSTTLTASADGVKAFIENAWGSVNEFVDDCIWWPSGTASELYLGQNDPSKIIDRYVSDSANKNSADAKTNKDLIYSVASSVSGQAGSVTTQNAAIWGFPSATGGSGTTGTTDSFNVPGPSGSDAQSVRVGGNFSGSVDVAGLSYANTNSLNNANGSVGSRLAFVYGDGSAPSEPANITIGVNDSAYGEVSGTAATANVGDTVTVSGTTLTINSSTPTIIIATPATDASGQYIYQLDGWFDGDTQITTGYAIQGDTDITAQFSRAIATYTVTWIVGDTEETETYQYGQTPTHTTPEAPEGQEFKGWQPSVSQVTGDVTYTAVFGEPSDPAKTMMSLIPLIVICALVLMAASALAAFKGTGFDLVKLIIGLTICLLVAVTALIPVAGGL